MINTVKMKKKQFNKWKSNLLKQTKIYMLIKVKRYNNPLLSDPHHFNKKSAQHKLFLSQQCPQFKKRIAAKVFMMLQPRQAMNNHQIVKEKILVPEHPTKNKRGLDQDFCYHQIMNIYKINFKMKSRNLNPIYD